MSEQCDVVAERVALGEPLGDLADHAASCAACRRLAALPADLGALHRDSEPGPGFAARMAAGAQHRIGVRRRRRVAAAGVAAAAATTMLVIAFTRTPETSAPAPAPPAAADLGGDERSDPWEPDDRADESDDVRALLELSNTKRSRRYSANWKRIERPLAPYRAVVEGVAP